MPYNFMTFEYDPDKSAANKIEHGIDFDEAQVPWDDSWMLEAPTRSEDEPRFLGVEKIEGRHRATVYAFRGENFRASRFAGPGNRRLTTMKAYEFDQKSDSGEDVSDLVDWSKAQRKNLQTKRVNVDFPAWMVSRLDRQAKQLGVERQSLIKMWIAERLQ